MEYRNLEQISADAEIRSMFRPDDTVLSKRERLERWATLLERQPERELRSIHGTEYGTRAERLAKRADGSPLSIAFSDPLLREEGLRGDRVGDAAEFFGLSEHHVHDLVCYCHNGLTLAPSTVAARVRSLARHADSRVLPRMGAMLAGASAITALGLFFAAF